jgi:hypothetical protein
LLQKTDEGTNLCHPYDYQPWVVFVWVGGVLKIRLNCSDFTGSVKAQDFTHENRVEIRHQQCRHKYKTKFVSQGHLQLVSRIENRRAGKDKKYNDVDCRQITQSHVSWCDKSIYIFHITPPVELIHSKFVCLTGCDVLIQPDVNEKLIVSAKVLVADIDHTAEISSHPSWTRFVELRFRVDPVIHGYGFASKVIRHKNVMRGIAHHQGLFFFSSEVG